MCCVIVSSAAMKPALPSKADTDMSPMAHIASLCGSIQRSLALCLPHGLQQHLREIRERPAETAEMMDLIIDKDITEGFYCSISTLDYFVTGTYYNSILYY